MKKSRIMYLTVGFLLLLMGCSVKEDLRPKRNCPIEQLLLDQSDYPSGAILSEIISPVADKPLESADRSVDYLDDRLFQVVIRYFSSENAIAEYNDQKKITFDPNNFVESWDTPSILELGNLSTNQYEVACGDVISFGKRCYMISQYEEYYIFFRADISDTGITHELFRKLVVRIDNKMSSCLKR